MRPARRRSVVPRLLGAGLALLLGARASVVAAAEGDALTVARGTYAKRLAALGGAARDAKLGALALRLFEDAHALDPALPDARLALGWTQAAGAWKPPSASTVPGEGWADTGDAALDGLEKKVADAEAAYVKDLLAAAATARTRKDFAASDRLVWAAIAVAPDDPAPRLVLAHPAQDGRFVAPEHAARVRDAAATRAAWVRAGLEAAGAGAVAKADPPRATVAGWPTPVAAGARAPSGDAAFALADADGAPEVARLAAATRGLVAHWLGAPLSGRPASFLLVPSRDLADALLGADPDVDRATLPAARAWPVWPLGKTGYDVLVAPTPGEAGAAAVDALAQREAVGRVKDREAVRWVAFGAGFLATHALLGAPAGYGATRRVVAGDTSPSIRPGEGALAFVRRLVALGADRPLRELATADGRALFPRDVAKAGALLDFLFLSDADRARAFLAALAAGTADRAAAVEAAAKAAGYPSADALDEAWRRFVADAAPRPPRDDGARGAFRVASLGRVPAPTADALFGRGTHGVSGSLWLAGRPYRCRPVADGQAVEVEALAAGAPPRVVRAPGVVPFSIPREGGGGFVEVRVELLRDGPSWTASAADACAGPVDGEPLVFVDLDLDGRYGGFGRDGVAGAALGGPFVFPLRRELVLGRKVVELRRVGPDGQKVAWRARPLAAKGEALDALLRLNAWRTSCGLPGLLADDALAAAATADLAADPRPDGDARPARLRAAAPTLAAALSAWIADPAARAVLLDPDARAAGLASAGGVAALRIDREDGLSRFLGPVVFPHAGGAAVPAGPAGDGATTGLPLTFTFGAGTDLDALALEVTLADAAGADVPLARTTSPGPRPTVVLTPKARLAPRTTYLWQANWDRRGTRVGREGAFTTE